MNETSRPSPSASVNRHRSLWGQVAVAVLLVFGLLLTHRALPHSGIGQQRVAEAEREEQFNRQLDRFVQIDLGRPVMLKIWLAEWSRQTGIPVEVRQSPPVASTEAETGEISLDLPPLPARHALDSLNQRYGAAWEQQEHERIILHWYRRDSIEMQHEIAVFPEPDFLAFHYPT